MSTPSAGNWAVRGATFALWALAALSATYWALKFAARPAAPLAAVPAGGRVVVPDPAAVARLLGANPASASAGPTPTLASRFNLVGVAARTSGSGAALISVDGKPAKPYRVGAQIEDGVVLQSVQGRSAVLAAAVDGPPIATLQLPPPKR